MQTASQLLQNIQDSPTKSIDQTLTKSVVRQIRKERQSLTTVTLEGVEVDNTLGSLAQLSNELWFGTALSKHKRGSLFLHYTRISRNIRKPNLWRVFRWMSGFIQGICDRQTNIGIRPHSLPDIRNSLGHVEHLACIANWIPGPTAMWRHFVT